jgi:glucan phosphoethanolaminetransferase (alkaline phosphatase superfamily)
MILKAYQYLFYHIQSWSTRRDPFPELTAFFTMGMAVLMNVGTLLMLLMAVARLRSLPVLPLSAIVLLCIPTLIPQYFAVLHHKRYEEIATRYKLESTEEKRRGSILASLYWIGSLVSMVAVAVISSHWRT